jgi:hypothetical protein
VQFFGGHGKAARLVAELGSEEQDAFACVRHDETMRAFQTN